MLCWYRLGIEVVLDVGILIQYIQTFLPIILMSELATAIQRPYLLAQPEPHFAKPLNITSDWPLSSTKPLREVLSRAKD